MTSNSKTINTRIAYVDFLKGLLFILVVFGHLFIWVPLRQLIFSFHMGAFVMISGYFYASRRSMWERIKFFLRVYLITALTLFCFRSVSMLVTLNSDIALHLITDDFIATLYGTANHSNLWGFTIDSTQNVGSAWFLLLCMWLIPFYALFDKIKKKLSGASRWLYVIFVGFLMPILLGSILSAFTPWAPWELYSVFFAFPFYVTGAVVRDDFSGISKDYASVGAKVKFIFICILAFVLSIFCLWVIYPVAFNVNSCYDMSGGYHVVPFFDEFIAILECFGLFGLIYVLRNTALVKNKFICFIGKNSLLFLCLHTIDFWGLNYAGVGVWSIYPTIISAYNSSSAIISTVYFMYMAIGRLILFYIIVKLMSKSKKLCNIFAIKA